MEEQREAGWNLQSEREYSEKISRERIEIFQGRGLRYILRERIGILSRERIEIFHGRGLKYFKGDN